MFRTFATQQTKSRLAKATGTTFKCLAPMAAGYAVLPHNMTPSIPSFTQFIPQSMIAYAAAHTAWVPHSDFKRPETIEEAVEYNNYTPRYSQPVPDYTNHPVGAVKKIVGTNFEEVVLNPEKDVFVQFSKAGCPSCQSFQLISDAIAFAFRDVPTVEFVEMKGGVENYVPGVLTAEEEVLFPSFKIFPAGPQKQLQMNRANDFVRVVREYNKKLLTDFKPSDPLPANLEPAVAKTKFEGVGISLPMTVGDDYVWYMFIDHLWDNATHKFDKDAVKKQLSMIEPALKREISHTTRSSLPGHELICSLSPCGKSWDTFQDVLLRRGVGATSQDEFQDAIMGLNQCLEDRYTLESSFWNEMSKLAVHMTKTLDIVNQAKATQGLTPDQAHEFFREYAKVSQKREQDKNVTGANTVPRPT